METDEFWALIDAARDGANGDPERQTVLLTRSLSGLAADDIVSFDATFRATRAHGYTWDLWAVGYLAAGGMSDDAFADFRAYLMGRGGPGLCSRAGVRAEHRLGDPRARRDRRRLRGRAGGRARRAGGHALERGPARGARR